jgi:hypothetical protein
VALVIAPVLLFLACGGQRATEEPAPAPAGGEQPAPEVQSGAPAEQPGSQSSPAETKPTTAEPSRDAKPQVDFPPADFTPPFERSAKPGDGKWVALGDAARGDHAAEPPNLLFKTNVHPHKVSRFVVVTVVAIDLTRASVHLVAGTEDPVAPDVPKEQRSGLVPNDHQPALLAVFNGGYQTGHGRWGVKIDSRTFVPPRENGCTLALYRDGSARIRTWPALQSSEGEMAAFRQTPPCLVEEGQLHPDLDAGRERAWGGRVPNIKTRNRSAVGVDRSGRILFFGFGDEAGPALLGEGMRYAGAVSAAQLDINYYWTRFLLFGKKADKLQVTSTLAPQMQHEATGYVARAASRDFFYVRRGTAR